MRKNHFTRREFVAATAATVGAMALGKTARAQDTVIKPPPVCVFSKHLQFLDYPELAKTCKNLKLDGVDLTVRKGGHVEPENVATDLPKAVKAIRAEGLDVPMITTLLKDGKEPHARPVLEAAGKLGIKYFRFGTYGYAKTGNPADELPRFIEDLKNVDALAKECGMVGGYHNHSGKNYVGAALWDLYMMFKETGTESIGANFDIGHATAEGGMGAWESSARLMAPMAKMMAVKDCIWENKKLRWVSLGEGQVQIVEFLKIFRNAGFAGPISIHFEYKTASNEALIEEIRKANLTLRSAMKEAGYA